MVVIVLVIGSGPKWPESPIIHYSLFGVKCGGCKKKLLLSSGEEKNVDK